MTHCVIIYPQVKFGDIYISRSLDMDTKADKNKKEENVEEYSLPDVIKKMMLAGVGAVSIIQEELEKHIDKLVERGEIAQKDREEMITRMKERRMKFMHRRSEYTRKHVTEALEHFDVPRRSDIESLNQKIADLEKKIDELNKPKT
jgi:poly(hydroxyalkanoate) granule-associated protein